MIRVCNKCGSDRDVQEHHIIPKHIGKKFGQMNTDYEGRILLCGKCQNTIHCILANWTIDFFKERFLLDDSFFPELKEYLKKRTARWLNG